MGGSTYWTGEDVASRCGQLCRVSIPNSQALSLLGRDLYDAHLQVLLGDGEEISKSVATSVEDSSARNAAPSHMWKSRFQYLSEESASQPAGLRKSKMPLSVFFRDARLVFKKDELVKPTNVKPTT
ncbi:hypothetical protein POTOM_016874 [Populus tomentosa]|uniref:Uncharacterized protein n=1 Tax=Populus tomentosa TaxID=118781 RepID=A0A8X7ZW57_POPTO|nr:hypothetical protein POTOM_016874 [Populus tomentosa]